MDIKKKSICNAFLVCIIFMLSSMSVLADNVEDKQLVHKDKIWTFTFKEKIKIEDINKNIIFIKDSEEKNVEVTLELQDNKRTVLIKPPSEGYKPGEQYTLFLGTNIGTNDKSTNYLTIEFIIENQNTLNSIKDKEPTFDKKTISVKDNHWLCEDIEYEISLENVVTGDEAWEIVKQSNRFNSQPTKDKEYILAKFNINLKKTDIDRYVKFDNEMFKIISENNKVYYPHDSSIVLDGELDNRLTEGEMCSGWIAGYVDKEDNPSIVINKGKESEVAFKIKNNVKSSKVKNNQEENDEEKRDNNKVEKDIKDKEDKKEILTKEELLKYVKENKNILFKDMMNNKEFEKNILNNYLQSNNITDKDKLLYYLNNNMNNNNMNNNNMNNNNMYNNNYMNSNNNDNALMMLYLYQMLYEKKDK